MSSQKPGRSNLTREQIKAEREAKKAAKAAAKKNNRIPETSINCIEKDKTSKASDEVSCVANGPLETSSNSNEQADKTIAKDVTKTKGERVAKEVSKQDTVSSVSASVTNGSSEDGSEIKSKAELRAERRAKQEAQRAAKQQQAAQSNITPQTSVKSQAVKPADTVPECPAKRTVAKNTTKEDIHEINLFKHLYQEREQSASRAAEITSRIHPAIVKLGIQYAKKIIVGSNARCVALLAAVRQMVGDFEKPAQADFVRGLNAILDESLVYLRHCRPWAVSMQNAISHLKRQMTQFPPTLSDDDAKSKLQSIIDTYIKEEIQLADQAISLKIQSKISNGNVILTYGYSSLIYKILVDAHVAGKQFRVIVVDGRPWLEGKELLRRLARHGLECSYILINALSFVMPEVSKVFLGAHALLANGAVMSRAGTAQVALTAKACNVPVLVACETHKSCGRVQTDSIVYNELGDADELVNHQSSRNSEQKKSVLSNWRTKKSLNLLNITYDVTPADFVTGVVTELAILPCTSVPVILRIKPSEI